MVEGTTLGAADSTVVYAQSDLWQHPEAHLHCVHTLTAHAATILPASSLCSTIWVLCVLGQRVLHTVPYGSGLKGMQFYFVDDRANSLKAEVRQMLERLKRSYGITAPQWKGDTELIATQ